MGRAFDEHEKEAIRASIVRTGLDYFTKYPFEAVKIEEIAKAVGIGKGTFYRFFESKETLLVACTMAYEEKCQSEMLLSILPIEDGITRLRYCLKMMMRWMHEEPFLINLINAKGVELLKNTRTADERASMLDIDINFLNAIVKESAKLKVPEPVAVELLRSLFYLTALKPDLEIAFDVYSDHLIQAIISEILEAI